MANDTKHLRLKVEVTGNGAVVIKELNGQVGNLTMTTKQAEDAAKRYNTTLQNLTGKTFKVSGAEYQKLSNSVGGVSSASGAATASVLELGRVISDAPYGIRGMANNLSQLSSQFAFMTNKIDETTGKAVGFRGAITQIGTAIKANLVLLLIQTAISAIDYFSSTIKKAEKDLNKMNEAIGGTAGASAKLIAYSQVVKTSSEFTNEYRNAMEELKSKGFDPAIESIDDFINKQLQLLKVRAKAQVIEQELNEIFTEQLENEKELREINLKIKIQEDKLEKENNITRRNRIRQNIKYLEGQKEVIDVDEKYKKLQQELIALTKEELSLKPIKLPELPTDEELDAIDNALDLALPVVDERKVDNETFLQNEKLRERYETLNMTKLEQLNYEEQLALQQIEDESNAEEARTEITEYYANKRKEIREEELEAARFILLEQFANVLNSASMLAGKHTVEGKALAIASTTISTYVAAQEAYEKITAVAGPVAGGLAAANAVIQGLGRVKQIMSVKIPNERGTSAPSTSGGGDQSREFDFNLVGSTAQNQLAEGIAGQFGQPIQAYVVSTQMSSQQQLDNIIQSSATLGDDGDD